jgi:hypothetical protein
MSILLALEIMSCLFILYVSVSSPDEEVNKKKTWKRIIYFWNLINIDIDNPYESLKSFLL